MDPSRTQPPQYQWRETRPGAWERDIDEVERFYKFSARKDTGCFPVTACASFVTSTTVITVGDEEHHAEGALRRAWVAMRHRHPTLGSRVQHEEDSDRWKRVYTSLKSAIEEEEWLQDTFKVVETDVGASEWLSNCPSAPELPTVFLLRSNDRDRGEQTVFLRCPHDMTDGVGILQLLDQLFDHAAVLCQEGTESPSDSRAKEHEKLSPCLRIAAAIPETLSEAQTKRFEQVQAENGSLYRHPGLLTLPPSAVTSPERKSRMHRVATTVPESTTAEILRSCKTVAPGVSVTHVFMSALAMALANMQPRREAARPVRYVNHSMINLRPFCRQPYDSPEHAAAAYHTISTQALGLDMHVPASSIAPAQEEAHDERKFEQLTLKVRDFYKAIRPVLSAETSEQVYFAPLTFKSFTAPSGSDPHAVSDPPFCPVALSSIGNVASMVSSKHGPFELTKVWAASEPLGSGVALFLGSWNGTLELSGVFDALYHDAAYIEKFLRVILDCVYKGLRVDEHAASFEQAPAVAMLEAKKRKRAEPEGGDRQKSTRLRSGSPDRKVLQEQPAFINIKPKLASDEKPHGIGELCGQGIKPE